MKHPAHIYTGKEEAFYLPFTFGIDPMERLLLVNFEKDPDKEFSRIGQKHTFGEPYSIKKKTIGL